MVAAFSDQRSGVVFTENRGQLADLDGALRPEILYTASFAGVEVFVAAGRISYVYRRYEGDWDAWNKCDHHIDDFHGAVPRIALHRMDMELVGSNPHPIPVPSNPTTGYSNYYLAHCPNGVLNVVTWRSVVLKDVYPKIDMVLRGNDRGMKCDFIVHPGGRPSDIRMRYSGSGRPELVGNGELRVENPLGFIQEDAPFTYQSTNPLHAASEEGRREVASRWIVDNDGIVRFDVAGYDTMQALVIDPTRQWATFYGGVGGEKVYGSDAIEVDRSGDIYITGSTSSTAFPVTIGPAFAGVSDIIVVKLKGDGTRLWATMIGGTSDDLGHGIAADYDRNVFITGHTESTNFPLLSPHQATSGGLRDAIVAKFNVDGVRQWSTYFGGSALDDAYGFAIDSSGNPTVVGVTASTNAIAGGTGYDLAHNGGTYDAFLARFSTAGLFQWGTYAGGVSDECGWAAAADINNNISIAGWTTSTDFPTLNPFQGSLSGGADCFVMQFNSLGTLRWSTYYGGSGGDGGNNISGYLGLATDGDANVVLAGATASLNFPLSNPTIQGTYGGGPSDGFIARFNTDGLRQWATYQGGGGDDRINGVATNSAGSVLVTGGTSSTNFPGITADAFRSGNAGGTDAFIIRLTADGTRRQYGTYYGGSGTDAGLGISFDPSGSIVFGGETNSPNFPVTAGCLQATNGGVGDAFISLFCDIEPGVIRANGPINFCRGESVTLSVADGNSRYLWSNGSVDTSITVAIPGLYYVDVFNNLGCKARSDTVRVAWHIEPNPVIRPSGIVPICEGDSVLLDAGPRRFSSYGWYDSTLTNLRVSGNGPSDRGLWAKEAGTYRVIVVDTTGCIDTSATVTVVVNPKPVPVDILPLDRDTFSICKGEALLLAANRGNAPGESFTWIPGGWGGTFTPTVTGDYRLRVTNASGCSVVSRPIHVIVRERPVPLIRSSPDSTICEGDTVQLDAYGGNYSQFRWSTGETTSSIRVASAGLYTVEVIDSNACKGAGAIAVHVVARPMAQINPAGPVDLCDGESMQLDAGAGFTEYLWSTGERSQTIVVNDSGDYTVQVRGGTLNCPGRLSNPVTVRIHPRPSAAFAGPVAICINSTASYVAATMPNVRYEWTLSGGGGTLVDGQGTDSITVAWGPVQSTGRVHLRVTDTVTLCSHDTVLSIAVGTALAPTVSTTRSTNLCPGDSVTLDAGGGYDSYRWIDNNGNLLGLLRSLTVKDAGLYRVRVAKESCAGESAPIRVRHVELPTPQITLAAGDTMICIGGSALLDAGPFAKYIWSPGGATTRTIAARDSGAYQVMVTDSNGCSGLSQIVRVRFVDPLPPQIIGAPTVCLNTSTGYTVAFDAGTGYTWSVTGGVGAITAGQGSATVTITWGASGVGFVSVAQTAGMTNCTGISAPYRVDVGATLTPTITTQGMPVLCDGDSIVLHAPQGFASYRWRDASGALLGSTDSLLVRSAGTYSVDISTSVCSGTGSITITAKPTIVPTISGMGPLCEGDTLVLEAGAGYARYLWSTGDTTQSIRVAGSGSYSVRVIDVDGCIGTAPPVSVTTRPRPAAAITAAGRNLVASPGAGHQWYLDGTPIPGATTESWRGSVSGAYSVRVTDSNGCSATSPAVVLVGASATIAIRDYQASPGERVSIPLELSDGVNIDGNGIRNFTATIRFNRTLLVPTTPASTSYQSNTSYVGDDCILAITGAIPTSAVGSGTLATLEFIATLGSVTQTPITIGSFSFVEDTAVTTTINGTFSLTGLCTNGGTRLVNVSGATALRPVRPNPVAHTAEVEYEVVEDGLTQLYLVDILGGVTSVVHAELKAGRYVATFDVSELSSGVYVCVLQTATERLNAVVRVAK